MGLTHVWVRKWKPFPSERRQRDARLEHVVVVVCLSSVAIKGVGSEGEPGGSESDTGLIATLSQTQDEMTGDITPRILMSLVLYSSDYRYCLFFHYILSMEKCHHYVLPGHACCCWWTKNFFGDFKLPAARWLMNRTENGEHQRQRAETTMKSLFIWLAWGCGIAISLVFSSLLLGAVRKWRRMEIFWLNSLKWSCGGFRWQNHCTMEGFQPGDTNKLKLN